MIRQGHQRRRKNRAGLPGVAALWEPAFALVGGAAHLVERVTVEV